MAVVITTVLPSHVTIDMVRDVESQLDMDPVGLITHAVTYDHGAGSVRMIDLWESEQAFDEFAQHHLAPVVRRVAAAAGYESTAPVSRDVTEALLFRTGPR